MYTYLLESQAVTKQRPRKMLLIYFHYSSIRLQVHYKIYVIYIHTCVYVNSSRLGRHVLKLAIERKDARPSWLHCVKGCCWFFYRCHSHQIDNSFYVWWNWFSLYFFLPVNFATLLEPDDYAIEEWGMAEPFLLAQSFRREGSHRRAEAAGQGRARNLQYPSPLKPKGLSLKWGFDESEGRPLEETKNRDPKQYHSCLPEGSPTARWPLTFRLFLDRFEIVACQSQPQKGCFKITFPFTLHKDHSGNITADSHNLTGISNT